MASVDSKTSSVVITPYIEDIVSRALSYLTAGFPVHFTGPAGVGKTTLAQYIAKQLGRPVTTIYGNHEMGNFDFLGGGIGFSEKLVVDNYVRSVYKRERQFHENHVDGQLVTAVQDGHTLVYDEFTRSRSEINNVLLSVLEERVLPLYGAKNRVSTIPVHPNFSMIFTSNPAEYAGVFKSADALMDRMITIDLSPLDAGSEAAIVAKKTGLLLADAKAIVEFIAKIRAKYFPGKHQGPSMRTSIKLARVAAVHQIPISAQNTTFQTLCYDVLNSQLSRLEQGPSPQELRDLMASGFGTNAEADSHG